MGAASGVDDELAALSVRAREWYQRVRRKEGKARSREGASIAARPRRNLEFWAPVLADDGDELVAKGGVSGAEIRGEMERGVGGLEREVPRVAGERSGNGSLEIGGSREEERGRSGWRRRL
jgi:hypothetical protein